jgi:hypothetical protein
MERSAGFSLNSSISHNFKKSADLEVSLVQAASRPRSGENARVAKTIL